MSFLFPSAMWCSTAWTQAPKPWDQLAIYGESPNCELKEAVIFNHWRISGMCQVAGCNSSTGGSAELKVTGSPTHTTMSSVKPLIL